MESFKFVQTIVWVVGVFFVSNVRGKVDLKTRMSVFETRINTLQLRFNTENEMIKTNVADLEQDVASLNKSVAFLEEICPLEGNQVNTRKTKKSQMKSAKLDEILQISNTVFARGLDDEKKWIRARLTTYENQMQKSINESKSEINDYKTEIDTKFSNETDWMRYKMDLYENEIHDCFNDMKSKMTLFKKEIELRFSEAKQIIRDSIEECKNDVKTLQKEVLEINIRDGVCPPGWTAFRLFCYKYVAEKRTYDSARDYCRKLNAHVADIESHTENDFLVKYVESIEHTWSDVVWIGLTDEETEGVWISDRTGRQTVFTNFRSDQPDGGNNGRDQNCLVIGYSIPYDQWNDWGCDATEAFVCKMDKVLT